MLGGPKISVLVTARKDSPYLQKFLANFIAYTEDLKKVEVLVMINKSDTVNKPLAKNFTRRMYPRVRFYQEDYGAGRPGVHLYFRDLYKKARGEWIIYFCDDHSIIKEGWDQDLLKVIEDREMSTLDVWCIVPKFDNQGAVNHVLSRGYIDTLGGMPGRHGWIDSYINDVVMTIPERVVRINDEWFHDYTLDKEKPFQDPDPSPAPNADKFPSYQSHSNRLQIDADRERLEKVVKHGRQDEL